MLLSQATSSVNMTMFHLSSDEGQIIHGRYTSKEKLFEFSEVTEFFPPQVPSIAKLIAKFHCFLEYHFDEHKVLFLNFLPPKLCLTTHNQAES